MVLKESESNYSMELEEFSQNHIKEQDKQELKVSLKE